MSWERWRIRALAGGLLTALAVAGCAGKSSSGDDDDDDDDDSSSGPSCTSVCDEVNACPGADETIMCASYCDKLVSLVKSAGCTAELTTYLECYDGVGDKCDSTNTTCDAESTAFSNCVTPYCVDSAHTAECTLQ